MIDGFDGIKIMDLCDPEWLDNNRPYFNLMSKCDAIVTSTKALAEYIGKIITDKPVLCIPDRVDLEEHKISKEVKDAWSTDLPKTAVWFGYSHNFYHIEKTLDVLRKHNLKLTVMSDKNLKIPDEYESLELHNVKYDYNTAHEIIARHDIAILPTTEDLKGRFKSNNKSITAMALGVPVARLPEDLERLMNPKERKKASEQGLKEVKEKWDVKISVKEYKKLINSLC